MQQPTKIEQFQKERNDYNEVLAKYANRSQKIFFGLDAKTYEAGGALDKKQKNFWDLFRHLSCDVMIAFSII